jgi:septum formation protein
MIYLASQSPRRKQLLEQINIPHQSIHVDIDETPHPHELPQDYVTRMAIEKVRHAHPLSQHFPVLAADTSVICDGRILGKPVDETDFMRMMQLLGNRTHQVLTAVAVMAPLPDTAVKTRLSSSEVSFRSISEQEAMHYWKSGEPCDKAGGYGIQGLGAVFIKEIHGSYSGIMGLPLYETAELLSEFGVYSI